MKFFYIAVCLLLTVVSFKIAFDLGHVLFLEAHGALESDDQLFLIMGRGLLNGLIPYRDLFESKPPGMFLLFALSLLVTGDDRLVLSVQIGIFLTLPLFLAGFAWLQMRKQTGPRQFFVVSIAVILGILLALCLEEHDGSFRTESFGAFFACLYALHVFLRRDAATISAIFLNAMLLGLSAGFKEPFLLSILAVALISMRGWRHFLLVFVIPLVIALSLGIALLLLLGYVGPYVSLYLPAMLFHRISVTPLEPLWLRGFAVGRLLSSLTQFYVNPLLGVLLAFFWLLLPLFKTQRDSPKDTLLIFATSLCAYVFLIQARVFLQLLIILHHIHAGFSGGGFLLMQLGGFVLLSILFTALLSLEHRRGLFQATLCNCVALYVTCIAIGIAQYAIQHWGFAFPLLFAMTLLFLSYMAAKPFSPPVLIATVLILVTAIAYRPNGDHIAFMATMTANHARMRDASRLDLLLEKCGITSYVTYPSLALAHHSPVGPVFALQEHAYLPRDHPLIQQTYANWAEAQLIIIDENEHLTLPAHFSKTVPMCAKDLMPFARLTFFFRKD